MRRASVLVVGLVFVGLASFAHKGVDPVGHWVFDSSNLKGGRVATAHGPVASVVGAPKVVKDKFGECVQLDGADDRFVLGTIEESRSWLPKRHLTASAWVSLDELTRWGGIIGALQDNGDAETGFILGYSGRSFYLGVSSVGADDGNGKLGFAEGRTQIVEGRLYHVVGTYDGATMKLYVNGVLEGESKEQSGDILYPEKGVVSIGAYIDDNERYLMKGRVRQVSLYSHEATAKWVAEEFAKGKDWTSLVVTPQEPDDMTLLVDHYYNYVQPDSATVSWETSRTATSIVRYGLNEKMESTATGEKSRIHHVKLNGLRPNTKYHVSVESTDDQGRRVKSEMGTFLTAPPRNIPFTFAAVGDTQDQPHINTQIAAGMWSHRPNFLLLAGDLVGSGNNKSHWVNDFFKSMRPFFSRVPIYPVLGNHEEDAKLYYDYFALPEPEYYYDFRYGNAHFFVIDTNIDVRPGSEQYRWLDEQLGKSDATWKFVSHHHPPYSSDENDYGDLWKGPGLGGDLRARQLSVLYDKHNVDIVWTGHIHSYERTWPVRNNEAVVHNGTIYMVIGGGGGGLETPGPTRWFFTNTIRYGHHFTITSINGPILEFKAYDINGNLFDVMRLNKTLNP